MPTNRHRTTSVTRFLIRFPTRLANENRYASISRSKRSSRIIGFNFGVLIDFVAAYGVGVTCSRRGPTAK